MTTAQKNQFSEFEYFQAPDFAKGFDEVKNMDAWSDVGKQLKANEKAQEANIKSFQNLIDKAGKFSVTAKKAWEVQRDKEHKKLTNENKLLVRDLRLAGHDRQAKKLAAFNKADSEHDQDTGYYNVLAAKLDAEGQGELAQRVRQLTGRRGKVFKEVLALNAANRFTDNLNETIDQVEVDRGEEDGNALPPLTWANAKTTAEAQAVMDQWQRDHGLDVNGIGGLSDEFLAKHYWPAVEAAEKRILDERYQTVKTAELAENEAAEKQKLLEALKTGGDSSGQAVEAFVINNKGTYGGEYGAKIRARDLMLKMVEEGQITVEQFKSIYIYKGIKHRGMNGKLVGLDAWDEFNIEKNSDLYGLLEKAELAGINKQEAQYELETKRFVIEARRQIEALDRPITEKEASELIATFRARFGSNYKVPDYLKGLLTNTMEDIDDEDIVAEMEDKLRRGEPITDLWRGIKGDPTLRETWRQRSLTPEGQGLDPAYLTSMNKEIDLQVKDVLGLTMGTSQTMTPTYHTMTTNAKVLYAEQYRQARDQFDDPKEAHRFAREKVINAIRTDGGKALKTEWTTSTTQSNSKRKALAFEAIANNGTSAITSGMLPGTETDFKRLEAFARDPLNNKIPPIYHQIARTYNKDGTTGYDIAAMQYKAVTGKDFPSEPSVIKRLRSKSPITQYFMTRYPSRKTITRAVIEDKLGGDYSSSEVTIPNLNINWTPEG